jgi:uncharacterized membrane protein
MSYGSWSILVTTSETVRNAWDEHVAWSSIASQRKSQRTTWRVIVLVLTILGALLSTLAATLTSETLQFAAGLAGTLALTFVPIFVGRFLSTQETSKWLRARSISEGIKSEVYKYCACAAPYAGEDADEELGRKWREIRAFGDDLTELRARVTAPQKEPPPKLDPAAYLEQRVRQQITTYYRRAAKENADKAARFRAVEFVLAIIAAALGAVATFTASEGIAPWVAVVTTVGGSLAAYAAASRYEFQATTFYATARQLGDLAENWRKLDWSEFVRQCEDVISAENRAWMAKLADASDKPPASSP